MDALTTDQRPGGWARLLKDLGATGPAGANVWGEQVVVVNPDGTPITPGAGGGATLVARANAAAPAWAEAASVPLSVDLAGNLRISGGGGGGGGMTDAEFSAHLPLAIRALVATDVVSISGTVPISAVALPLPTGAAAEHATAASPSSARLSDGAAFYDARAIRALTSADVVSIAGTVPVSGTFWQGTQPVSGTFWQASQPISAAALPLPTGASTEATLALIKAKTDNLDVLLSTRTKPADSQTVVGTFWQATQPVSGTFWATLAASPSAARLTDGTSFYDARSIRALTSADAITVANASLAVTGTFWQATQPVSIAATVAVAGAVAHGTADSGNPEKVGGKATLNKNGLPAAVAAGARADAMTDEFGRFRVVVNRPQLLGAYKFESGRLAVLASAHASTAGFFWLINPVGSGVVALIKKVVCTVTPVAATAFVSAPRITVERVTFTGTASGAQITTAKRDSTDAAALCTVRTASTGLTLTGGAIIGDFTVPAVLTAVGINPPVEQYLYDATDDDDYVVLRAGEGLVFRQADAGTTSDTRIAMVFGGWEERAA